MKEKNKDKNDQLDETNKQISNTVAYEDNEFEMMSIPDGGSGNKAAVESLKRATN